MFKLLLIFILLLILPIYFLFFDSSPVSEPVIGLDARTNPAKFEPEPLTIESIFKSDHSWTATLSAQRKRVVIATGDVMPARVVNINTVTLNNFNYPYEKTADELKKADITFINLETPLIANCKFSNEGLKFCGDSRNVEGLVFAGVDVVNFANNHTYDYGKEGVKSTIETLVNKGLSVSGVSGPIYKDVRGLNFAFLGFTQLNNIGSIPIPSREKISAEIAEARVASDIVIVQFHWGDEYTSFPTTSQKSLGRLALDSGADLVIGNHPHWIQPVEIYNSRLVAYSHGNFVFDQEWSIKTKQGVIGKYTFYDNKLIDVEFLPVFINDFGQPEFMIGESKDKILNEMKQNSLKLKAG